MELIQETKNEKKNEGGITLRDIVELIFDNWYWIVLSVAVCVSVAWIYLSMQTPLPCSRCRNGLPEYILPKDQDLLPQPRPSRRQ